MRISFDPKAHAATFILSDEPVVETVEAGGGFLVDLDEFGGVVAVEVIDLRNPGDLHALAEHFDIEPLLQRLRALAEERSRRGVSRSEEAEISEKVLARSC